MSRSLITRFYLVRHGPTHAKTMIGWSDLEADLSDQGTLDRLSAYLPKAAVMISSDLRRAVATADCLQGPNHMRLAHDPNLRELHFGAWEGQSHAMVDSHSPKELRAFWEEAGDVAPPLGESWNKMHARVTQSLRQLAQGHQGHDIIIVAHFGAILGIVQYALDCSVQTVFAHKIDNLSATVLSFNQENWSLEQINLCP